MANDGIPMTIKMMKIGVPDGRIRAAVNRTLFVVWDLLSIKMLTWMQPA